ncbi:unnamed protein product [Adineta ricciae]|uniref:Cupin type-1 domain-containing protein n=1 Tax=Adineta ricciae TaxID=249248 RepID=A0A814V7F9_ADIRI|nr:unnamed protein product [Adineta ricciae]CAF1519568.1 unnamed protein product [Adineta ricciae]
MAIIAKRNESQQIPWLPSVGVCCGLSVIAFAIAATIVLGLIPVYLSTKSIDMTITNPLVIAYRSNMINGSRLTIGQITALTRSFRRALHLQGMTNLGAEFAPLNVSSTHRRKRANGLYTDSITGDLLNVQFSLRYSIDYDNRNCENQVIEQARVHISRLYTVFTLPISFTNGYTYLVQLRFCGAPSLSITQQCFSSDESANVCETNACHTPLTRLQNSNRYTSSDYIRNLLNSDYWIRTPGGNVSYFNLSTTPALANIGIAFSIAMLEPCGVILPHIHPRGSKGIYMISGISLLVGFVQENRAQVVLNEIQVGYATLIPRGAIHFVQNLGCTSSVQIDAYNNADPGLLTLGLNMFRFPDSVLSAAFGQTEDFIINLKRAIPAYPLDVNKACRTKCGLPT